MSVNVVTIVTVGVFCSEFALVEPHWDCVGTEHSQLISRSYINHNSKNGFVFFVAACLNPTDPAMSTHSASPAIHDSKPTKSNIFNRHIFTVST